MLSAAKALGAECIKTNTRRALTSEIFPLEILVGLRYIAGGAVIAFGGVIEIMFGVNAEKQSLENIARPLACRD
jgi:hypothetical protein